MAKKDKNQNAQAVVEPAQQVPASVKSHESELLKIQREQIEKSVQAKAKESGVPYIDVTKFPINPDVLHVLTPEDAHTANVMPFFKTGKTVRVAVFDPSNPDTEKILKKLKSDGYTYEVSLATEEGIREAQGLYESEQYKPATRVEVSVPDEQKFYQEELKSLSSLKKEIETLTAEQALAALHAGAIKSGASDIHYQPEDTFCSIRFRIDGMLYKVFDISRDAYAKLLGQLKYRAGMKLNVTDVPQDGRYFFTVADKKIDVRAASIPTEFGEAVSCRILDTGKRFERFEDLGFSGRPLKILKDSAKLPFGMVLVAGPTGSGKTTTLYALLKQFNKPNTKIVTLEDPIEYHLQGIVQSQVSEKRNYTFASGVRSILRHDPDVVMVGEIRDLETAQAACQAALTGHVLLSTLHTNSAIEAVPRLLTIGVQPFVIAPSLHTIVAQRLARKVCDKCAQEKSLPAKAQKVFTETLETLKSQHLNGNHELPQKIMEGKGCDACNGTGYRGRVAIAEAVIVDDAMKEAVLNGAPAAKLLELARAQGMLTMREDGILKAMAGITTLEEVFRVTAE